ncbi:MAG: RNA polymerase, sigma-24 subunit, ECF subfamily [Candidatus Amesbacteria bacterium GW2011_GWA2_42_12]|uniref:RNA polymerase, sigma-24 subunit, ECF subfamily n=1 Tax=Candidatus Amesbacteria bacterium GW2011_GWA2_42_12 TaxID=1618356 RepID=A0A0G1AZ67_9BACT|nr:MAG: RNA polymerase, sigma-24 subunit, ECF subfamily [Candidatus Amesbacteria bacterium GW2011_GWA2_42_12]
MQKIIDDISLKKLRAGDNGEVLRWFKTYEKPLLRFIRTKVGNEHDAQELCQNTFLACLDSLPLFKENSSMWTWMYSIARHEIADYFRKRYAKKVLQMIPFADALLPEQFHDMHDVSLVVRQTLQKLSAYDRELLLQKYVDGCSVAVIAKRMKKSFKSVEAALFRARKLFAVIYEQENE